MLEIKFSNQSDTEIILIPLHQGVWTININISKLTIVFKELSSPGHLPIKVIFECQKELAREIQHIYNYYYQD